MAESRNSISICKKKGVLLAHLDSLAHVRTKRRKNYGGDCKELGPRRGGTQEQNNDLQTGRN